jgi:hypothetical protein
MTVAWMRGLSPLSFQGLPGIHYREPTGWGNEMVDPLADRGLSNITGTDAHGRTGQRRRKGKSMALLELSPSVNHHYRHNGSPDGRPPVAGTSPVPPAAGERLRFQLRLLVNEILADQDLHPDTQSSLLRHLAGHPGRPAAALLAHLREVLDPDELVPVTGKRRTRRAGLEDDDWRR